LKNNKLGKDFVWGTSISAFQTEGTYNSFDKGLSIWDDFTLKKGKIKNRDNAIVACDFYNLFYKDIGLVKCLNIPHFKFSLSWSRILPSGTGKVNQQAIDYYNNLIDLCIEMGITPWITLYHWDLPLELEKKGGWTNRNIISWFSDYVELCALKFGDRVKKWIVMNEPLGFTGAGYFLGYHAPGRRGLKNFLPALHHAALCQAEGGRILKKLCSDAEVGTSISFNYIEPISQKEQDLAAARRVDALFNRVFLEPVLGMGYPMNDLRVLKKLDKYILAGDEKKLAFDFDFIGLQTYTREVVKFSPFIPYIHARLIPASKRHVELTSMLGWENYPDALYHILNKVGAYAGVKKIYVTENGAAFNDYLSDGRIHDLKRTEYLQKSISGMIKAKQEGVNVQGFFVWSLMDNFEWAEGYGPRFGLVYVDRKTLKRTIKQSGEWYKNFISNQ
jgi:beta-glucosidase